MKRIEKKLFVLLTLFAMPLFGEKITIQNATEMAIKNNRDIKKGMLEIEKSRLVDSSNRTQHTFHFNKSLF